MSRTHPFRPRISWTSVLALLLAATGVVVELTPTRALADEGMWTYDNFPSAAAKIQYGVESIRRG